MKTKAKEKKKKAREKQSKERVLKRRTASRARLKEEREEERLARKNREREEPFMDTLKLIDRDIGIARNDIVEAKHMKSSEKVIKSLEHNLEILLGMRNEYLEEQANKQTLNEELEKAGCKTLEDKVKYLEQQAQNLNKDENEAGNVGGSADVKCSPNVITSKRKRKPLHMRKESATCEVVKAETREDLEKE